MRGNLEILKKSGASSPRAITIARGNDEAAISGATAGAVTEADDGEKANGALRYSEINRQIISAWPRVAPWQFVSY